MGQTSVSVFRCGVAFLALAFSVLIHVKASSGYWSLWFLASDSLALGLGCVLLWLRVGSRSILVDFCSIGTWFLLLVGAQIRAYEWFELADNGPPFLSSRIESAGKGSVSSHLTVLSYNLQYNSRQRERSLDLIRHLDAELVLLQEVNEDWALALQELAKYKYRAFAVRPMGEGLAILSQYPLSETETINHMGLTAQCVDVKIDNNDLGVCNIHLISPAVALFSRKRTGNLRMRWAQNMSFREQQWEKIEAFLLRRVRSVWLVAGDFNTIPRSPLYRRFGRYLQDVFDDSSPWTGTYPHVCLYCPHPKARIDYIFVKGAIELVSRTILWGGGSDHLALTAKFRR